MSYASHYTAADAIVVHLNSFVPTLPPQLQLQYAGFAAISSVTVYELALKQIFADFSARKHSVFGHFVTQHFDRINGRISLKSLRNEHIPLFGEKYLKRFNSLLDVEETRLLRQQGYSVKSSYGNLVTWRHGFAHGGQLPNNATFLEVTRSYELGKVVIDCLAKALVR